MTNIQTEKAKAKAKALQDYHNEDNLHPEAFHLMVLGEDFHDQAIKGTITFMPPSPKSSRAIISIRKGQEKYTIKNRYSINLQEDTAGAEKIRNDIAKDIFKDLRMFCRRKGYLKRKQKINFYLSGEIGKGNCHFHFIIYKEGFNYWNRKVIDDIRIFLSCKIKHKTHAYINELTVYEKRKQSFSNYINKKEKVFCDYKKLYENYEGKKFFSDGLMKTLNKFY